MAEISRETIAAVIRVPNAWGKIVLDDGRAQQDRLLTAMAVAELEAEFAIREKHVLVGVTVYEVIGLLDRLALAANSED